MFISFVPVYSSLLLLFFKQKTAYEIRISDWSSDVCSSDLPSRVAGFATMLGGAESHTAIMARSLGMPAVLGVAGLIGAVKTGDAIVIDGGNGRVVGIGRATCRERGWQ